METRLPHKERENTIALVIATLEQHSVTHRSLETQVDFLLLASKGVQASHLFLHQLHDALTSTSRNRRIRVSSNIQKDLTWWQMFNPQYNAIRLLHDLRQILRLLADISG
jgi:hypothetical protein